MKHYMDKRIHVDVLTDRNVDLSRLRYRIVTKNITVF